jgi:hypothetical protein
MRWDLFRRVFSTSFLPRSWAWKSNQSLEFEGGDFRLAYSSNAKEKQVYILGTAGVGQEERTPNPDKGW